MIIKKRRFKLTPGFSAKDWPFSCAEFSVSVFIDEYKNKCFVLLHNGVNYALSGAMEDRGLPPLRNAKIWVAHTVKSSPGRDFPHPAMKSLSPIFSYLERVFGNGK